MFAKKVVKVGKIEKKVFFCGICKAEKEHERLGPYWRCMSCGFAGPRKDK